MKPVKRIQSIKLLAVQPIKPGKLVTEQVVDGVAFD
jgi:hypothetical protein